MKTFSKYLIIYLCLLGALVGLAVNMAQAAEPAAENYEEAPVIDQAELDQLLAPIALYPDTLLSHILVASTYPLEVIQAQRWRENNEDLSEDEALEAAEDKDWDPSVKAIAPFSELLTRLTDDLEWLQRLGDAFLYSEEMVLSSVQTLRRKARDHGSLDDNTYIEVVEEDDDIVIQPVEREVVYVPYYDTRVVYGRWWWDDYPPIIWVHPRNYVWHAGFYWSPRFYIHNRFFFSGFHWHRRHLVVNHHYYYNPRPVRYESRRVRVREYQRWQHEPVHRRGVRYASKKTVQTYDNKRVATVSKQRHAAQPVRKALVKGQQDRQYQQTYSKLKSTSATNSKVVRSSNKERVLSGDTYRQRTAKSDRNKVVTRQTTTSSPRSSQPKCESNDYRQRIPQTERSKPVYRQPSATSNRQPQRPAVESRRSVPRNEPRVQQSHRTKAPSSSQRSSSSNSRSSRTGRVKEY